MTGQVAAERPDPRQRDQVAEGHRRTRDPHGDDVTEDDQPIAGPLEPAPRPRVDVGQLVGVGHAGLDERLGPYRHGPVGQHRHHVGREPDGEHAHAAQMEVRRGEPGQQRQRRAEEQPLHRRGEQTERDLQRHPNHGDNGVDESWGRQVGAVRSPDHADHRTHHTGDQDGDHRDRR
ncbi:MAG: hypothetical protein U5K30_07715 [Acidimicrobiales bacterium]|nr:hypothetical protein [Acidimicrobiales bacterium]